MQAANFTLQIGNPGSWSFFHTVYTSLASGSAHWPLPLWGGKICAQQYGWLLQAACLARCNGARVELHRAGIFSLEEFRETVRKTSTSETEHLIASYSRKEFLQTGEPCTLRSCSATLACCTCHTLLPDGVATN